MAGPMTVSTFNRLGQYASSPGNRPTVVCYAEFAVSSLAVTDTIANTHCAYHEGVARLSRPGWLVKYQDGIPRIRSPILY